MKKFLTTGAAFLFLLFLLCAGVELVLLFLPNQYSAKVRYMDEHLDAINTLFMGNSHIANGVDVRHYAPDSVYNFALSARHNYYDGQLVKRYVPQMKNLKTLFMALGVNEEYHSYFYDALVEEPRMDEIRRSRHTQRTMYYKYNNIHYGGDGPFSSLTDYSELLNSDMAFASRLLGKYRDSYAKELDNLGFTCTPFDKRSEAWETRKLPVGVDFSHDTYLKARAEVMDTYRLIAQTCREHHVRLILLHTPYWHTAREKASQREWDDYYRFVAELRSEYPEMEYLDLSADPRFLSDDFNDATHLSVPGSQKLAKLLRDAFR